MFNRINNRRTRNALAGLVLAGSAVVGATGVVNAASDGSTAVDDTEIVGLVAEDGQADPADQAEREARREARREGREAAREEMAALLGLEVEDLSEQLRGGSTLADVAAAQGVEVSAVVDLIVDQKTERLDTAVADGRLSQEEADEKAAELEARVQTGVEEGRPERSERGPRGDREAPEEMAALLGLEVEDLSEQLRGGSTLADVAAAQGVEVSAVVDLIVDQKTERLDTAVADGRLSQEEADEKAAELEARVQTGVEEGRPERGERGPRGDRGPRPEGAPAGGGAPADGQG